MWFWPAFRRPSFYTWTFTAALIIALLQASLDQSQAADPEPKRVLMLHSFGPRFKPWSDYAEAIRSQISQQWQMPVDFLDHSLVDARQADASAEASFIEYLRSLYFRRPVDLIVAIGAPAAVFVQRNRQQLFPVTPMIFTAVEQRRVEKEKLTAYDTVVAVAHDFPAAFDNILRILPVTKTIAVVNGTSPNEVFWEKEMRRELAPFSGRVELRWYNERSFKEILKDAASLPPHSAVFWHLMNVDAAGVAHEANAALNMLSASANAPIFSYDGSFFGEAIVGGPMHSVMELSQITAAVAIRIFNGEKAGDIKTPSTGFAPPIFDWRQMQRWGIGESNLPPGSTIHFRQPTVWERYSWQIGMIIAVILAQAGLIVALLTAHRQRRLAEVQSAQRTRELATVSRFATAGELTASIAHEINQPLASILTNAEAAEEMLKSATPDIGELREIVKDILHDDRRATEVIRRTRNLLKKAPFDPKTSNLNEVAREAVNLLSPVTAGRQVELRIALAPIALPVICDHIQMQQVIINLVVNAMDAMTDNPSETRTVSIRTSIVENFAELSVSDHGPGIPEDKIEQVFEPFFTSKAEGMGMGLSIARTIIEAHNGRIWAENRDHGGAAFKIRLPIANDDIEGP